MMMYVYKKNGELQCVPGKLYTSGSPLWALIIFPFLDNRNDRSHENLPKTEIAIISLPNKSEDCFWYVFLESYPPQEAYCRLYTEYYLEQKHTLRDYTKFIVLYEYEYKIRIQNSYSALDDRKMYVYVVLFLVLLPCRWDIRNPGASHVHVPLLTLRTGLQAKLPVRRHRFSMNVYFTTFSQNSTEFPLNIPMWIKAPQEKMDTGAHTCGTCSDHLAQ